MRRVVLIVGLAFVLQSCAFGPGIDYRIALTEVERPEDAKQRYGEAKITTNEEEGQSKWHFSDALVAIVWLPSTEAVSFILENKSSHSLKILWDEASLVGPDGVSHRVMHEGVRFIERNAPQPPTVVAKGAKVTDTMSPSDMVEYNETVGWTQNPMLPYRAGTDDPEGTAAVQIGKTIRVLLPMEIEGVVNEYTFTFTVESANIKGAAGKK
ncbi:MAG TPA: hypothetical protein PLD73_11265 [Candidatus Hydrogenedentes bacterium]|jgi:hypothetical protein|nr:hypothetical protein [Candidatus Hydrogenedentota bacterium]